MITALNVNPCIDKTLSVEKFDVYKMNRATVISKDVSGKGINISMALRGLEKDTFCVGLDFIADGEIVKTALDQQGIKSDLYAVNKPLRVCTKIFDCSIKHSIEVNEYGAAVEEKDGEEVIKKLIKAAKRSSFITFSGSLPKGLSEDFYYRCATAVQKHAPDCKVMADAEKSVLIKTLKAPLYFIKPNVYEFEDTFNLHPKDITELSVMAKDVLKEYGLKLVCVSLGKDGAIITDGKEAFYAEAFKVNVRSIQGAGDSMVAGIISAIEEGQDIRGVLLSGVAASAASVMREGTKLCLKKDYEHILAGGGKIFQLG